MAMAFDELNSLSKKRIEYSQYFGEMELSEEEKRKRIKLAEELEFIFLAWFEWISEQELESLDSDAMHQRIDVSYCEHIKTYIGKREIPTQINEYVANITLDITESTLTHLDDEYYLSDERASVIAANEANVIGNYRQQVEAIKQGYKYKVWNTMRDDRVRHTHVVLDAKKIGIFESFDVGLCQMMYPKDASLGATAEEIVNCRCSLSYSKD